MVDPFPQDNDEDTMMFLPPEKIAGHYNVGEDYLCFDRNRYNADYSIPAVYIPSEYLMLKMMRACIKCDNENDLWFNQGEEKMNMEYTDDSKEEIYSEAGSFSDMES